MSNYLIGEVSEYINNIHEVAKDNPMASKEQYETLRNSIQSIGQQEPIKIWRNKVVDGRNRLKALNDLGINEVKCIKLPHKASRDELQAIADGSEARRHQTPTQLAIKAFRVSKKTGISLVTAAKNGGVSESSINLVSKINKIRPDILDDLLEGKLFKQSNGYATDSLQAIKKDVVATSNNSTMSKDTIKEMITNADKKSEEDKKVDELENKLKSFIDLAGITEDDYPQLIEAFDRITYFYRLGEMSAEADGTILS